MKDAAKMTAQRSALDTKRNRIVYVDTDGSLWALPLSLTGTAVAVLHVLLVAGIVPESVTPCSRGVPCSETQIEWFGFVSIPLLSAAAFTIVTLLLIVAHFRTRK